MRLQKVWEVLLGVGDLLMLGYSTRPVVTNLNENSHDAKFQQTAHNKDENHGKKT